MDKSVELETNENLKNYVVFEVNYDGVFMEYPLRCSLEEGLTIFEGDVDMNKKYDIDAGSMSPEELVAWAEEEAGSPYLRTPPLKPRRKSVEFHVRICLANFCIVTVLLMSVVYDGPSLPHMEKDSFANDAALDARATKLLLLLKKKGRSGANYGRLGSLIGLNEHESDDNPQVTTQVSLTVGSTNNDVIAVD
ncbi:hypothetical protein Tco_0986300 [Tanacetum coccineum]